MKNSNNIKGIIRPKNNEIKKLLIISFDLIKDGESKTPLAISSIIAYLKNDKRYGKEFLVQHISINMKDFNSFNNIEDLDKFLSFINYKEIDFIALSAYIWNEFITNKTMNYLRANFGFNGEFILGGYQITFSKRLQDEYPDASYFVNGYAEKSLLDIITSNIDKLEVSSKVNFAEIPSPYLSNEIPLIQNQKVVRFETKRGCPYSCSFCAHRDLLFNKVHNFGIDKIYKELSLFKDKNVGKINIIDPIFNQGKDYLKILEKMLSINLKSQINIQTRFELIVGEKGLNFLDYCEKLNINLEFGMQTAIGLESEIINRKNRPHKIKKVMHELNSRGINYEISLIYGLPTQTLSSFKKSISFVKENGCKNIKAFPLMLLKGTELYDLKNEYCIKEEDLGDYNIPTVTSSNSFTKKDWLLMQEISLSLLKTGRI